ncbi:exosortase A [Inhella inkyongensis]|uniref:Exosortase A n=1 Tax=Inhella inkyongensis TaxID=392593 RepID=A0A840S2K4_9BURK|nr:exosortase A [Inhella inkyongensis]MBB5203973.1 exosortase A [Inhella inkyongensis]
MNTQTMAMNWRKSLLILGLALAGLLGIWREATFGMVGIWWRSDTFAHGLLVLPIAGWLVWRDRERLIALNPQRWAWPLLPLALAALMGGLGQLAQVDAAAQLAVVLMVQALVLSVLGPQVGRALAFPLLFLLFGVPIGEFMLPTMMDLTADFTVSALRLSGVPVYREGLNFVIPTGHWSVVEACSGVRYLMASVMVGTLFAYLNFGGLRRRLLFVGVAFVVPLLANWLRAYFIVMLGHLSNNKIAAGVDHLIYGWVFFGIVMFLMFAVGARFSDLPPGQSPERRIISRGEVSRALALWAPLIMLSLSLVTAPLWLERLRRADVQAPASLPALTVSGWSPQELTLPWRPKLEPALLHRQQALKGADGHWVLLDVGLGVRLTGQAKAIGGQNLLLDSEDRLWRVLARGRDHWRVLGPGLWGRDQVYLLRRLHWVDGRFIQAAEAAKLAQVWQMLKGQGDAAAQVVLLTPEEGQGAQRLQAFTEQVLAPLNGCLQALALPSGRHNAARCD